MTHALEPIVAAPRAAGPQDLDAARRLLSAAGLPLAGVDEHFAAFSVLDAPGGGLLGIAGVERHGAAWLLRSVVVAPEFRGRGHGSVLVGSVLAEARRARAADVFLLTMDAQASSPRAASVKFLAPVRRSQCDRAPSSKAPVPPPQH